MIDKPKERFLCKKCGEELEAYYDHPYDDRIIITPCSTCILAIDQDDVDESLSMIRSISDIATDIEWVLMDFKKKHRGKDDK